MPRLLVATTIPRFLDDFLIPYALHFRRKGWRVDALSGRGFEGTEAQRSFDATHQVRWSRFPLDPRNLVGTPRRIREIVRAGGYDLIHVHSPVAAFVTRYAVRGLPRRKRPPIIYTAHGFHFHPGGTTVRNSLFLGLEKLAGRWTDYLVLINREDVAAAVSHRLVAPGRVRRMPGIGVDTERYCRAGVDAGAAARVRAELGLGADEPYFLMVAEFIPRKRHADLVSGFARLSAEGSVGPHLVLAGQGPLLEPMRDLAGRLGIARRVHLLGQRRDVPALMAGAAAVVLPSEQEGLPRCVLEAMSMAVPVVATRIRGTAELLEDGAVGFLVEVGDVKGLAATLFGVLADPGGARAIGARGRQRAADYDLRSVIRLHEELYEEALGRAAVGRAAPGTCAAHSRHPAVSGSQRSEKRARVAR
jgi:glycosyltransferase involved in cell wall biosynthesis